ncbi:MAG: glutamate--tRNA ligase [Bacteroidales bacterium]|jgi:glutamyl-tRNA synthetase|nr:glutamate--tRNA ligase [Bacteroidales bacterium]
MSDIRVRFAPSPTGPLHMGGVRTALFNYLFAKKQGGKFILRIEDTDQSRYVQGAEDYIMESLAWCGIQFDEGIKEGGSFGPYKQSERKAIYQQYAQQLIDSGNAYYAFDTADELNTERAKAEADKSSFAYNHLTRKQLNNSLNLGLPATIKRIEAGDSYVIRFKMPDTPVDVPMKDIIRGDVTYNSANLDDKVLYKSDGLPTYHLANIVDDHLMQISHVIRGEEWLPSMPLHVLLYQALGWDAPQFAHLPLILKPTGKGKLSKRDGDKLGFPVFPIEWNPDKGESARGYREEAYYPEAFVNMLALLGWNPGTEQELFSMDELIQAFDLERVNKAGARFDPEKTKWFNHQYLMQKSDETLAAEFMPILESKQLYCDDKTLAQMIEMVKERVQFVPELWDQLDFFFIQPKEYNAKMLKKSMKGDALELLEELKTLLFSQDDFSSQNLEDKVKTWIESKEIGFGKVMNPLRLALVGEGKGPHLFDILEILGKAESLQRIEKLLNHSNDK